MTAPGAPPPREDQRAFPESVHRISRGAESRGGTAIARDCAGHRKSRLPVGLEVESLDHRFVCKEDEVASDGLVSYEAHRLFVGGLAEEALADPQYHWVNHQPQLVDEVML